MAIYEKLKTLTDSVVSVKSALKAKGASIDGASLSYLADKTSRLPVWDTFKSPLAQLGYTPEDEAVYKDLKIDMTTVKEDVEYSLEVAKNIKTTNFTQYFQNNAVDIKYVPRLDYENATTLNAVFSSCENIVSVPIISSTKAASCWGMFNGCKSIERIKIGTLKNTNVAAMFQDCTSLESVEFENMDTSSAASFAYMFSRCSSLKSVDISDWNTENVTESRYMFSGCSSLTELNIGKWNMSKNTNMVQMFLNCASLTSLDLNDWDVSNVASFQQTFSQCKNLRELKIDKWDVSNAKNMNHMFSSSSIESLDLSGWNVENVTQIPYFVYNCGSLTYINLSGWNLSKNTNLSSSFQSVKVTGFGDMFFDCTNVANMNLAFYGCPNLDVLRINNLGAVDNISFDRPFDACNLLGSSAEGLQALRDTFVNNSFDRAAAGYSPLTIKLTSPVKARLTDEEKAAITAKGFTIA
jgi:surface protein